MFLYRVAMALVVALLALPVQAQEWSEILQFGGYLESDTRFIIDDYRGARAGQGYEFELNRNEVNLRLGIQPNDSLRAVVDTRFRYYGFNQAEELPDLVDRAKVDPYAIYLDEAYLHATGVIFESLDLKIGRMIQNWGAVDQFNPTDNLNSRDLSDPLDYTKKVPNQMVELSAYPTDWLTLTAVWVPVFKPAQLPPSANHAFAVEYDEQGCFANAPIPPLSQVQMLELKDYFGSLDPCKMHFVDPRVQLLEPERTIESSQAAARMKLALGSIDLSLSYYYGRFGFPVAYTAVAHASPRADDPGAQDIKYTAEVMFPRMQVVGLDFAHSAEWLFGIGFMGEVALIFPEEVIFGLRAFRGNALEIDMAHTNVSPDPFVKGTFGMDYTFPVGLYFNLMYVHGFFDEFNDMYGLHDYIVAATEMKFFEDELAIRLAGVWDMTQVETGTLNPQITWVVFPGAEIQSVGMWFFGDVDPPTTDGIATYDDKWRFGQKAAGRNVVSLRARATW